MLRFTGPVAKRPGRPGQGRSKVTVSTTPLSRGVPEVFRIRAVSLSTADPEGTQFSEAKRMRASTPSVVQLPVDTAMLSPVGQKRVGATRSRTCTVCVRAALFPQASVAVQVRRIS